MKKWKTLYRLLLMLTGFYLFPTALFAQGSPTDTLPDMPGQIKVYQIQGLAFGAFSAGATGGTVIVNTQGQRSVTGTASLINAGVAFYEAVFEIEAPQGYIISVTNGPNASLTGSNGGTMNMILGSCSPASPFLISTSPPSRTTLRIGGTLQFGNVAANPTGAYTGSFYVTLNVE